MPNDMQLSQPNENQNAGAASRWMANATIALLPVLACFLGGSAQKWEEGIVVTLLGLLLLVRPPRFSLGTFTDLILLTLFILAAVAFLPDSWFFRPAWRATLVNDLGIQLPSTLTPQPWITLTYLLSFAAGLSWLYVVSAQELELREARFQFRLFTSGIVFLGALCIAFYWKHTAPLFWHNEGGFGPFADRNQNGDLFGLAGIMILACAQDDLRRRRKWWIVWIFVFVVIGVATALSGSRSGTVILLAGSAIWLAVFALRQNAPSPLALGASVLLLVITGLLLFDGHIFERFYLPAGLPMARGIFLETFRFIRGAPWCGIGFGNFEAIFAIFRGAVPGDQRALHPGSDWLWLWAEIGWPAVVLTVVGIALLVRRIRPLRAGTNQGYRLAAVIAALLFAIDGIIDVSGHQVGTAFAAMFLLGLSLHRPLCLVTNPWTPIIFRLLGLTLLGTGLAWVVAARGEKLLPGSVGVSSSKQLSTIADRERNFTETTALATRGLQWAPLDGQLYLTRAVAEVALNQPAAAIDDFRRARFLEPTAYEVPLAEGNAWLSSRPALAVTAWREALRRAGPFRSEIYAGMLSDASLANPEVGPFLEEVALGEHDLTLPYLDRLSDGSFNRVFAQLLKKNPSLKSFTETEKLALFAFWSERGDPGEINQAVEQHPEWLGYAWLGVAKYKAGRGDFRGAYELTQRFGEPVALPRVPGNLALRDLKERFQAAPDNSGLAYELYRAQMEEGRVDEALVTVRHFTERPNAPSYFHVLEARCWAEKQNWERAWNAWQEFQTRQRRSTK
jgi:tetratricopeptide (TPR) repeat protein